MLSEGGGTRSHCRGENLLTRAMHAEAYDAECPGRLLLRVSATNSNRRNHCKGGDQPQNAPELNTNPYCWFRAQPFNLVFAPREAINIQPFLIDVSQLLAIDLEALRATR
jgi:hypothetical protein